MTSGSALPELIEHYRLVRPLGAGGMGEVYLAHDLTLDRQVAIKFLPDAMQGDEAARRRLLREAQAAASLDHPAICQVHEIATSQGRSFIVMQFCEGETLADRLGRGPLSIDQAIDVVSQVCDALAFAHRRGVIHRDIKPQNVMVTADGRVKVLDFGLAKSLVAPPFVERDGQTHTQLTQAGAPVGTAAYMAPEQVRGGEVDHRADIFATGVLLFECLTGERPFKGQTLYEVLDAVCRHTPPPPSTVNSLVTPALDFLTMALLEKSPMSRPASAALVRDELRTLRSTGSQTGSGVRPLSSPFLTPRPPSAAGGWPRLAAAMRGRRVWMALAAAAVLVALALWAWLPRAPVLAPPPVEAERWYARGVEALRDGSYQQAVRALEQAITLHRAFPLAHARLAEASAELDDSDMARDAMLAVAELVPDRTRLDEDTRWSLEGIMATVQRRGTDAVAAYARLAGAHPREAHYQVDLGRAYELVPDLTRAEACYSKAIELNPQYAAAYLRRGVLRGQRNQHDEAIADFGRAEELFKAASDLEGETEVYYQRGAHFNRRNRLVEARADLTRALQRAAAADLGFHRVRALLQLSEADVTDAKFADAEARAREAVTLAAGLDTLRATSLIDFGNVFLAQGRFDEAEARFREALQLAERRHAPRATARAQLALASTLVTVADGRVAEGQQLAERAIGFYRANNFARELVQGLQILGRAADMRGDLDGSEQAFTTLRDLARERGDALLLAEALDGLGTVSLRRGDLPSALDLLDDAQKRYRQQGNRLSALYLDMRRIQALTELGRFDEARAGLTAFDREARAAGIDPTPLSPYLAGLEARLALFEGRAEEAATQACAVPAVTQDALWRGEMTALCALAKARNGAAPTALAEAARAVEIGRTLDDRVVAANIGAAAGEVLWRAGRDAEAVGALRPALDIYDQIRNAEAASRCWPIVMAAAGRTGDTALVTRAREALDRTQSALAGRWPGPALDAYRRRADVAASLEALRAR
ncbi:MAG: protein kinase [Vicinamibacteraceae bacterium]|nr:protein kinase [Vicinamibacteraceae bacterium]